MAATQADASAQPQDYGWESYFSSRKNQAKPGYKLIKAPGGHIKQRVPTFGGLTEGQLYEQARREYSAPNFNRAPWQVRSRGADVRDASGLPVQQGQPQDATAARRTQLMKGGLQPNEVARVMANEAKNAPAPQPNTIAPTEPGSVTTPLQQTTQPAAPVLAEGIPTAVGASSPRKMSVADKQRMTPAELDAIKKQVNTPASTAQTAPSALPVQPSPESFEAVTDINTPNRINAIRGSLRDQKAISEANKAKGLAEAGNFQAATTTNAQLQEAGSFQATEQPWNTMRTPGQSTVGDLQKTAGNALAIAQGTPAAAQAAGQTARATVAAGGGTPRADSYMTDSSGNFDPSQATYAGADKDVAQLGRLKAENAANSEAMGNYNTAYDAWNASRKTAGNKLDTANAETEAATASLAASPNNPFGRPSTVPSGQRAQVAAQNYGNALAAEPAEPTLQKTERNAVMRGAGMKTAPQPALPIAGPNPAAPAPTMTRQKATTAAAKVPLQMSRPAPSARPPLAMATRRPAFV